MDMNCTYDKMQEEHYRIRCCCVFLTLQIEVEKKLVLFEIHGQGVDKEPTGILKINNSTGEIFVHGPVDYEKFKVLKVRKNLLKQYYYNNLR